MRRLNDKDRERFAEHAAPDSIRTTLAAERAEHRRIGRRVEWLEDLLLQRSGEVAAGTWPRGSADATPPANPDLCPQNLSGEALRPGNHHRPEPSAPCVFCESGRTWVFNSRSVNRLVKHAHLDGVTLCPRAFVATAPMSDEEATRQPLCPRCRDALTATAEASR